MVKSKTGRPFAAMRVSFCGGVVEYNVEYKKGNFESRELTTSLTTERQFWGRVFAANRCRISVQQLRLLAHEQHGQFSKGYE